MTIAPFHSRALHSRALRSRAPTVFELQATFNVVIQFVLFHTNLVLSGLLGAVGGGSVLGGRRGAVDVRAAVLLFIVSLLGDLVGGGAKREAISM